LSYGAPPTAVGRSRYVRRQTAVSCVNPTYEQRTACVWNRTGRPGSPSPSPAPTKPTDLSGDRETKYETVQKKKEEVSACTDPAHPFYCSGDDFVIAARRSTCVASPRECLDATKIADYTASLTAKGAVTVRQCGSGKKRCADGSCAAEGSACSGIDPCSSNSALPISCGDGVTCQRSKVECRKKVKLFGCEPGMVKCGGVRFLCAATQAACSAKTGCTDPTHKVCGFSRDAQGKAGSAVCRASCSVQAAWGSKFLGAAPSITKADLASTAISAALVDEDDGATSRARFHVPADTFEAKAGASSAAPSTFTVGQVSDTDLNNGVFKSRATRNKLRSVFVDIEPPIDLEFKPGASFSLDFDVNDEDISGDTTKCAAALAQMTVVSADSATSSKSFQSEGACQASTLTTTGACFCKATVSHFSV